MDNMQLIDGVLLALSCMPAATRDEFEAQLSAELLQDVAEMRRALASYLDQLGSFDGPDAGEVLGRRGALTSSPIMHACGNECLVLLLMLCMPCLPP